MAQLAGLLGGAGGALGAAGAGAGAGSALSAAGPAISAIGGMGGGGGGEETPGQGSTPMPMQGQDMSQPIPVQQPQQQGGGFMGMQVSPDEMMQAIGNDPKLRQYGHEGTQRSLDAVGQFQQGLGASQPNMNPGLLNNNMRPMGPVQRGLLSAEQLGLY